MVNILGVYVDNITMQEVMKDTQKFFDGKAHIVFTPNPEIIMACKDDEELRNIINSSDISLPDGIGVVIASKILGRPLRERVSGFDYVCELLKLDKTVYLFGGKPGVAQKAMDNLIKDGVKVVGCHDGYFDDDTEIIEDIKSKKPDILVVCLGAPKQERWIYEHYTELGVPVSVGAGGSLDVLSGEVERAPEIYQKLCIEWLYRAVKEPKKRLPRIMKLPAFIKEVILNGKKYED